MAKNLYCMKRLCSLNINSEKLRYFKNYWKYKDIELVISLSNKNQQTINKIFPDTQTILYNNFDIYSQNSVNKLFTFVGSQRKINLALVGNEENIKYICYKNLDPQTKISTFTPILLELTFNNNFCDN